MKFLLLENIHVVARDALIAAGHEVSATGASMGSEELVAHLEREQIDVLGIRSRTQLKAEVFETKHALQAVGAFCIGTNQIDLEAASRAGVAVFNAPFSNTRSVAELILAEIVVLSRSLGDRSSELHLGKWRKVATGCNEVRGKTLGIVGYGHIGRQIGVLAEMIGMTVIFHDVLQRLPMGNNRPAASLDVLLSQSDFVTLHVPETPATAGLMGADQFARMKNGARFLNASRGTVVDLVALASAIRSGHVGGAAIDVFPTEPEANSSEGFLSPLQGLPNVILTPHIGGSTSEAQENIGREVSGSLLRYLEDGSTMGSVSFPEVDLQRLPGRHRLVHVHQNVPGVLGEVNGIVSRHRGNILGQVLGTNPQIGYVIIDFDSNAAELIARDLAAVNTTIRVRALG
ncbi:MAG: phosphoglycerate dehydrogenase [Myxococcales bacterium]|nr:phosphoglycerate dehydrogenase [Myxococcales bacterium]